MDPIEKLSKYISFTDMNLNGFSDTIEDNLKDKAFLLEDAQNDIAIDSNGLLEIVDQVSSLASSNVENLNMYEDRSGIKTLLSKIQEFYLIRKIELHENLRERRGAKNCSLSIINSSGVLILTRTLKNDQTR